MRVSLLLLSLALVCATSASAQCTYSSSHSSLGIDSGSPGQALHLAGGGSLKDGFCIAAADNTAKCQGQAKAPGSMECATGQLCCQNAFKNAEPLKPLTQTAAGTCFFDGNGVITKVLKGFCVSDTFKECEGFSRSGWAKPGANCPGYQKSCCEYKKGMDINAGPNDPPKKAAAPAAPPAPKPAAPAATPASAPSPASPAKSGAAAPAAPALTSFAVDPVKAYNERHPSKVAPIACGFYKSMSDPVLYKGECVDAARFCPTGIAGAIGQTQDYASTCGRLNGPVQEAVCCDLQGKKNPSVSQAFGNNENSGASCPMPSYEPVPGSGAAAGAAFIEFAPNTKTAAGNAAKLSAAQAKKCEMGRRKWLAAKAAKGDQKAIAALAAIKSVKPAAAAAAAGKTTKTGPKSATAKKAGKAGKAKKNGKKGPTVKKSANAAKKNSTAAGPFRKGAVGKGSAYRGKAGVDQKAQLKDVNNRHHAANGKFQKEHRKDKAGKVHDRRTGQFMKTPPKKNSTLAVKNGKKVKSPAELKRSQCELKCRLSPAVKALKCQLPAAGLDVDYKTLAPPCKKEFGTCVATCVKPKTAAATGAAGQGKTKAAL